MANHAGAAPHWDPFLLLGVNEDIEHHCAGQTEQGARCAVRITAESEADAKDHLRRLPHLVHVYDPVRLQREVRGIALQLLCLRWHQNQDGDISNRWMGLIGEQMRADGHHAAQAEPAAVTFVRRPLLRAAHPGPAMPPAPLLQAPPPRPVQRLQGFAPVGNAHMQQGLNFEAPRERVDVAREPKTPTNAKTPTAPQTGAARSGPPPKPSGPPAKDGDSEAAPNEADIHERLIPKPNALSRRAAKDPSETTSTKTAADPPPKTPEEAPYECPLCYDEMPEAEREQEMAEFECPWCRKRVHGACFESVRKEQEKAGRPLHCFMCTNELGAWL